MTGYVVTDGFVLPGPMKNLGKYSALFILL
jgi:hypothetical protein